MAHHHSCRSCRHCLPPQAGEQGWCRLRQLPIHPELVAVLWCHHWTPRPPRLPVRPSAPGGYRQLSNRQLSLDAALR